MARKEPAGYDYSLTIIAPPSKVVAAFFVPAALAAWWDVVTSVTTPRLLGAYAIEWARTEERDEQLGRLGGVFHGTVMEHHPEKGFFIADAYWLPPEGEPIGPMALTIACSHKTTRRSSATSPTYTTTLHAFESGLEMESPRWRRYFEVFGAGFTGSLERLKHYLEHGRGAWDLGAW